MLSGGTVLRSEQFDRQRRDAWPTPLGRVMIDALAAIPSAQMVTSVAAGWELVFCDEFDQPSLDPAKWNIAIDGHGGGNQECQYYTADSVSIAADPASPSGYKGLALTISPIVNPAASNLHELPNFLSTNIGASHPTQRYYRSGKVSTQGHYAFQYGRVDVRAKLPAGSHAWPAIWLLPEKQDGRTEATTWPNFGEIDVCEQFGRDRLVDGGGTTVGAALHWGSSYRHRVCVSKSTRLLEGEFSDAFHVFSMVWQPSEIEWYVDGVCYATMDPSSRDGIGPNPEPRPAWPFGTESAERLAVASSADSRNPFYVVLNAAIGGTCGGLDVPPLDRPGELSAEERATAVNYVTRRPQVFLIDSVRVYQRRLAAVGEDGPYMSSTAPPMEPLPRAGAGNQSYHGTGNESVTARNFPASVPVSGTFSVEVDYNNGTASRYLHVDLLRVNQWANVAHSRSHLLPPGTGRVTLSLTCTALPADGRYVWSVWTVGEVDEGAEQPWEFKHAWQLYEARVGR